MRFLFLLALAGLIAYAAGPAVAGETKYTNAKGQYVGKQDAAGRFINAKGQVKGKEDPTGRLFDDKGRYHGEKTRDTAQQKTKAKTLSD